ncbi:MAG TPA: hypothetical protein O0X39_01765 [Methanocorpusculum sp.]|nr:hypothetical protein [Methanocorpusculum sp.]
MAGRPPRQTPSPAKKRITFYASRTVSDIIESVKEAQGSDSVTDALTQIILNYANQHVLHTIGDEVKSNYAEQIEDTREMRAKIEVLENRLAGLEEKYAIMNTLFTELQKAYPLRK